MPMATPTQVVSNLATTSEATVYTNTNGTQTVLASVVLTNVTTSPVTATVKFDDKPIMQSLQLQANQVVVLDNIKYVLTGTQTIKIQASTNSAVWVHIPAAVIS